MNCNEENAHVRDALLSFDEEAHTYHALGRELVSVTTLIDSVFPQFDAVYWSERKAPALGVTPEQLRAQWEAKAERSRTLGTAMHARIEQYYLGWDQGPDGDGYDLFLQFASRYELRPYRTEWRVFDEDLGVAGTLDFLERDAQGRFNIYDWKRSTSLVSDGSLVRENRFGQTGLGPAERIPDTSYWHYALQLSTYRYILARKYGIEAQNLRLGVFHPSYGCPYVVKVPYLEKEVRAIMEQHVKSR